MRGRRRGWEVALVLAAVGLGAAGRGEAPLVEAVRIGDAKAVTALLQKRVDVNAPAVDGTTALHWAVHRNDLKTVDRLLRAGANVKAANSHGVMPLALAAENGNAPILERLLKAGADPNTTSAGGETVLMTAARAATADAIKVLLAYGANVNAKEQTRDQTALMWAAAQGNAAAVKVLVERGADVNARSTELKAFHQNTFVEGRKNADSGERIPMFTPLLFAVRAGHIDAVRALLDASANVNDAVSDGTTALHIACINGHWELAGLLLDRGANAKADSPGGNPLHHIARVRAAALLVRSGGLPPPVQTGTLSAMDLVRKLVARGADVNGRVTKPAPQIYIGNAHARSQNGLTPLLLAALPADPEYIRVLLASGADPNLTSPDHTTVVMYAAGVGIGSLSGDDEEALAIIRMALDAGVDVNARNDNGDTALHGAAFRGYNPLVQYLIDRGAKLDVKNKAGWTPLMTAHWDYRASLLQTRPDTEALLRKISLERGLSTEVPTREEAIEKLVYGRGGPTITCPVAQTVQSAGGRATVVSYPQATATSRIQYRDPPTVTCTPPSGSEFPVGTTTVTCTATDANGRTDSCSVLMRVQP